MSKLSGLRPGQIAAILERAGFVVVRALLRGRFGTAKPTGFKALLAAAPLEGIDLTRGRDLGRDFE